MVLCDGEPKSRREIVKATKLSPSAVGNGLRKCWEGGFILRSMKPLYVAEKLFKGRSGMRSNTRPYYLYVFRPLKPLYRPLQTGEVVNP